MADMDRRDIEARIKEHNWTIFDREFVCTECGYKANDEEGKYLASCYWSTYSADIHHSDLVPEILNPHNLDT